MSRTNRMELTSSILSRVWVDHDEILDWLLDLLTTLTYIVITLNYSSIANLHTLWITTAYAKSFPAGSVFTSSCLVKASDKCYSSASVVKSCLNGGSLLAAQSSKSKSELLYDWRFTANQFVLASSPLRPTARHFFQLNSCANSPYVTSSLTIRWVCLLWICLAFRQVYISHIKHVIENFFLLHYTQVLCQYRVYRANHAYFTYLML
jgi:hypothetical protein